MAHGNSPHEAVGTVHDVAHWDTSIWPFVISFGILFALPLAFCFNFVYHKPFAAVIALGIGVPLIVAGVSGWTSEAMGKGAGLSYAAMGWFILAEAMIFVAFFVVYWYLRLTEAAWPPAGTAELPRVMPLVMTATLVSSSLTIHYAEHLLRLGRRGGFLAWQLVTIALGLGFLGMSAFEWSHLIREGFNIGSNVYGTIFFTITGFHGAHVFVGLAIFAAGLPAAARGAISPGFARTAGLYWHFVDIIWFFVVSQVYYW